MNFSDLENGLLILTGLDLPKFVITELCECLKSSIDILELRLNQTLLQNDALNTIFRSLNCDLKVLNLEGIQLNNELIEEFSNVIAFPRKPCFISFCYVLYGEMATICYFETYFLDDLIKMTSTLFR